MTCLQLNPKALSQAKVSLQQIHRAAAGKQSKRTDAFLLERASRRSSVSSSRSRSAGSQLLGFEAFSDAFPGWLATARTPAPFSHPSPATERGPQQLLPAALPLGEHRSRASKTAAPPSSFTCLHLRFPFSEREKVRGTSPKVSTSQRFYQHLGFPDSSAKSPNLFIKAFIFHAHLCTVPGHSLLI